MSNLPKGWCRTNLGEIASWGSGGTPSRGNPSNFNGNIPWLKTGELGSKYICHVQENISDEGLKSSSAKMFPSGSVAIAMYGATIGRTSILAIDTTTNQACAVAQPVAGALFNEFLYYFLLSVKKRLIDSGKGGAQPNISQGLLKSFPISFPPLNEQKRIVAKIEELFSELGKGVESLKAAKAQLVVYRQSVLKSAFEGRLSESWRKEHAGELESADQLLARIKAEREARYEAKLAEWQQAVESWPVCRDARGAGREAAGKPGKKLGKPKKLKELPLLTADELSDLPELPEGWMWIRLGACDVDVFDGPFGSHLKGSDYVSSGVRVIRLENIGVLEFKNDKESFVSEEKYNTISRHTVRFGDVIFSSFIADGTRVVVLPEYIDKAVNKADCFCVRAGSSSLSSEFISAYLSTRLVFTLLEPGIHGATRPRINTTQLKSCPFPICGGGEQIQIVQEIEARFSVVEQMEQTIEESLQKAESLRQSILKRAFEGKLVPQNPTDEPASELLARIRADRAKVSASARERKEAA